MGIEQKVCGFTPQGDVIVLYTMRNSSGASVEITNIGASIVSVMVPDRDGVLGDVVLGYQDFQSYVGDGAAMGKSIGRFAGVISGGRFVLDGKEHKLSQNSGRNHLNGGVGGFGNRVWESRVEVNRVVMTLESEDGEENYPGKMVVEAVFDWDDDCMLEITYRAKSFALTVVNLTSNIYFNLEGDKSGSIEGHLLQINSSRWLPIDAKLVPTGEVALVDGTPMDFRELKYIGKDIEVDFDQLKFSYGYNHCWLVDGWQEGGLYHVGSLIAPKSGRRADVISSQPGVQIYTGEFLQGAPTGKGGYTYSNRDGVVIGCQGLPDAPNKPQFTSCRLDEEDIYERSIIYRFSVEDNSI